MPENSSPIVLVHGLGGSEESFAELVKAAFTRRRKTLRNALSAFRGSDRIRSAEALARAGLVATRRPETLTIAEWVRLAEVYALA